MSRPIRYLRCLVLLTVGWLIVGGCTAGPDAAVPLRLSGATMGTTWSVSLGRLPSGMQAEQLQQRLQQRLDRINRLMSTYDPDSELSRFNNQRGTGWFSVSPETAAVVELAQQISVLSNGAFDVTIGPLVDLWGFGPIPRGRQRPSDRQVELARQQTGYRKLQVRREPAALRKRIPELRVDLSAIAKGYAVDQLAELLMTAGVNDLLVEIGGEMRMRGRRPDGTPWRIAIEQPLPGERSVAQVLSLSATGLATSGNYRNFFIEEGQSYAHTIDPNSGRPVRHQLASATVLDPSAARADALATALMVMGEQRAQAFCRRERLAALLLIHQGARIAPVMTDPFRALSVAELP